MDSLPAEPQGKAKNTGGGSLSLLQWIFRTQESNQGLLHRRQILYQLSYQGSFPGSLDGKQAKLCYNRKGAALLPRMPFFYPLPHSKDLFIFQSLVIENRIISSITPLSDSTASSHSLLPSPPTILWVPQGRDQALIFVKLTSSQGGSTEKVGLPITLFNHRFIFICLIFEFPHKILFPEVVWLKPLCKTTAAWHIPEGTLHCWVVPNI